MLLDRLNGQNGSSIKLPSLLAGVHSLLEKCSHHNIASSDRSLSLVPPGECDASVKAGSSDDSETSASMKTLRRLSPDSTAGCVDFSHSPVTRQHPMDSEHTDVDVLAAASTGNDRRFPKKNCGPCLQCFLSDSSLVEHLKIESFLSYNFL